MLSKIEIKKRLNEIQFYGCSGILVGDVLHYYLDVSLTWKSAIHSILNIIDILMYGGQYSYEKKGTPNILLLASPDVSLRKDHFAAFNNVKKLLNNYVMMYQVGKKERVNCFKYIKYPIKWYRQFRGKKIGIKHALFYSYSLLQIYLAYSFLLERIEKDGWEISSLLTFCDVLPTENYFTQKFNMKNIKTITLQHGTFNVNNNSWAYLGSRSKYFLAENQAAVDIAYSIGYRGNMIVVGSPHHLESINNKVDKESNSIGLIMNSPMQPQEDNIEMIQLLQSFCKENGKRLLVKMHPADDILKYRNILDKSSEVISNELAIEQFILKSEIVIVSGSSSFISAIRLNIPTFLFVRRGYDLNLFPKTDYLKFNTINKLIELIDDIGTENYYHNMTSIKKYLLGGTDIRRNYIEAINRITVQKFECGE